jgi:mono/diheme cytochrome c family protein
LIYIARVILLSVLIFSLFFLVADAGYAGDVANGKVLYESKCVICHGVGGTPVMPGIPVFSKGESLDKDKAELKKSILEGAIPEGGMAPPMPPMQGQLNDSEIDDLLTYIFSLKP